MSKKLTAELTEAYEALRGGQKDRALLRLLDAWSRHRSGRLAAIVEALSAEIDRPALGGKSAKARQASWLEVAALEDPLDIDRLMAAPWPGKHDDGTDRLRALAGFPSDPRIATGLMKVLAELKYRTASSQSFWSEHLDLLVEIRDERTLEGVRAADPGEFRFPSILEKQLESAARKLARETGKTAELPAAAGKLATKLESFFALGEGADKSEEDLYDTIYAEPSALAPRLVLADLLQERGDERGEFIALQCAREKSGKKPGRRERELLKKHLRDWCGPLEPHLEAKGREFRRGFLWGAVTSFTRPETVKKVARAPQWRTIEHLVVGDDVELIPPLLETLRGSLRYLDNVGYQTLKTLKASTKPWVLEEILIDGILSEMYPALTHVRHLGMRTGLHYEKDYLWQGDILGQLDELTLLGNGSLSTLLADVESHAPNIKRVRVLHHDTRWFSKPLDWSLVFDRDASGRPGVLTARFDRGNYSFAITGSDLARQLEALPTDLISSITVTKTRAFKPKPSQLEQLRAACERFPRLEHLSLPS